MALTLQDYVHTAKTVKSGNDTFAVAAGQSVKIETSPNGEEVLNVECPAGKVWSVRIIAEITETDV